ncbi:ATP-binding protein [Flavobacterium sp.]|uniref:ATP-binding protein n=1 Tax=Flavobacterium sp. TaxID=239 RepID=UPI00262D4598|nr:ATP-binding protein [Flavobacterium sp.]
MTSPNIIQGNPTKSFFIEMITRDISIKDSILDLLDNSIDGANKINPNNYEGLIIDITINKNVFIVKDNCGGFDLETAQKYAFRFGRPDEAPTTEGSIGRFGVGMKRALFKIGQNFEVESKTTSDHFQIDVDSKKWKEQKTRVKNQEDEIIEVDDWNFSYTIITEESKNLEQNGTYIRVFNLNKEVAAIFEENSFLIELEDDIERLLNFSLEKGIQITLNGKPLRKKGIVLFNSESQPYIVEKEIDGVRIRIAAGLSYVGEPKTSGWYIYCNDRLVLEADQSHITLWGTTGIPKWHPDYVMFKGIIFFDSEDTLKLPLTTTKKGVDSTSEIFSKAKMYIREAMIAVLAFLKEIRNLGNEANDYRMLLGEQEDIVSVKDLKAIPIKQERSFTAPILDYEKISVKRSNVRISFEAPEKMVKYVKDYTAVKSNKELGLYLFEYFLTMEDIENE